MLGVVLRRLFERLTQSLELGLVDLAPLLAQLLGEVSHLFFGLREVLLVERFAAGG